MEQKKTNSLKLIWIFGVILISIVLAKKEWRTKMLAELRKLKEETGNAVQFVRDNREQIVDQVRATANEVSSVVRDISRDVKIIGETASHLKESSEEIVKATREAADDLKSLKR
ncbi:hypothetical protein [Halalkalibacter alkaliphilus]|uniref:DUF948 domain-containing protein n=1 Tax=Halalkalibacter alkaliphilus TaxID=2917993 RepID=A0A9X2CW43_9BACI|nr:hypothetical protein [Halalkalibacter alkaliphilus]MCL7749353.1 hypothetical protein [Halalkalibacter alkaliphilus]